MRVSKLKLYVLLMAISSTASAHDICPTSIHADAISHGSGVVRVLNRYEGAWRGWADGCVNCDEPMLLDSLPKPKPANKEIAPQTAKNTQTTPTVNTFVPLRSGYCECSCGATQGHEQQGDKLEPGSKNDVDDTSDKNAAGDVKISQHEDDGKQTAKTAKTAKE